jgi:hypothetical protein
MFTTYLAAFSRSEEYNSHDGGNTHMTSVSRTLTHITRSFNLQRFLLTAIAIDSLVFLAGCDTSWITEFSSILAVIGPAIAAVAEILQATGVNIPANVLAAIISWANDASMAITQIQSLITQYEAADATAKPGILGQIQSLLSTVSANLTALLPTIHITDPATQAKVIEIFDTIADEIEALINLLPTVTAASTMADEHAALLKVATAAQQFNVKSAKAFKKLVNSKLKPFGKQA